jgi:formylglycine-generating enzyme required for sulfatase activity
MVVIPAGRFTMSRKPPADGRKDDDPEGVPKSAPAREVTIDRPFAAAVFDVTREEYDVFIRETRRSAAEGCYLWSGDQWIEDRSKDWRHPGFRQTGRDPVVCVSWEDAQAYVDWLNSKLPSRPSRANGSSGGPYRLLSWEEAEYAGGAGATTAYYWGNQASRDRANYGADHCFPCKGARQRGDRWIYTSPVGSFPPNTLGLYDMAGNVWQWTDGCFPYHDPPVPAAECRYGARYGGSWLDNPEYLRIRAYAINDRSNRNTATGFRVAQTLE